MLKHTCLQCGSENTIGNQRIKDKVLRFYASIRKRNDEEASYILKQLRSGYLIVTEGG
jgi:hypothetical protein